MQTGSCCSLTAHNNETIGIRLEVILFMEPVCNMVTHFLHVYFT